MKRALGGRRGRVVVATGAAVTLAVGAVGVNAYLEEQRAERLP